MKSSLQCYCITNGVKVGGANVAMRMYTVCNRYDRQQNDNCGAPPLWSVGKTAVEPDRRAMHARLSLQDEH
jgi:hypothetical protein